MSFLCFLRKKILLPLYSGIEICQAQSEVNVNSLPFQWREAPVYFSGTFHFSRHERAGERVFPFSPGGSAGFYFDYAIRQKFPFRSGLECQFRSFSLDAEKRGFTNSGKPFRQTTTGHTNMLFVQVPLLFDLLPNAGARKFHLMVGPGTGIRFWSGQAFSYRYEIPSDTLVITGASSGGNDAMDLLEVNALASLMYRPVKRFDIGLCLAYKLVGFSIGKENFFRRTELNTTLSFIVFYQLGRMEALKFRR